MRLLGVPIDCKQVWKLKLRNKCIYLSHSKFKVSFRTVNKHLRAQQVCNLYGSEKFYTDGKALQ